MKNVIGADVNFSGIAKNGYFVLDVTVRNYDIKSFVMACRKVNIGFRLKGTFSTIEYLLVYEVCLKTVMDAYWLGRMYGNNEMLSRYE